MPPCSANRNVTQLFRKNMPPVLKPGTHNQMFEPHQSLMRPFVLSLGTRDQKRQKTERKKMSPLLPVIQGFDFASLCFITRQRSTEREDNRQKGKRERTVQEQCGHARCLLVYHSPSSALQQLIQQQKDSFPLNQGSNKTHTHRRPELLSKLSFQLYALFFNSSDVYCIFRVTSGNSILNLTLQSAWFLTESKRSHLSLYIIKHPPLLHLHSTFPLSCSRTQLLSHPAFFYPYIHIYMLGSVPSSVIKKPLS